MPRRPPKKPPGRPTKLDARRMKRVVALLKVGNYFDVACAAAGLDDSTGYRWMERGEVEASGLYREFRDAVREAQAAAEVNLLARVEKASIRTWTAAAWKLERKFPRWAPRVRLTVEEELDAVLDKLEAALSPEEFERIAGIIAGEPGAAAARKEKGAKEED